MPLSRESGDGMSCLCDWEVEWWSTRTDHEVTCYVANPIRGGQSASRQRFPTYRRSKSIRPTSPIHAPRLCTSYPLNLLVATLHSYTMVLTASSRALLRAAPRASNAVRALSSTAAVKADSNQASPTFQSPFTKPGYTNDTTKIPDFSHYRSKRGGNNNLLLQYFMVGTMGALTAAGAKATVQGTFSNWRTRKARSRWNLWMMTWR